MNPFVIEARVFPYDILLVSNKILRKSICSSRSNMHNEIIIAYTVQEITNA